MFQPLFQESEKGSWHVPITGGSNEESSRTWLCITRPGACEAKGEAAAIPETSEYAIGPTCSRWALNSSESEILASNKENHSSQDSSPKSNNKTASVTGKRKERSPSPTPT